MLELLMRNAGRVLTRESLIEKASGEAIRDREQHAGCLIRLLRGKIEAAESRACCAPSRGVGYCLRAEEQ